MRQELAVQSIEGASGTEALDVLIGAEYGVRWRKLWWQKGYFEHEPPMTRTWNRLIRSHPVQRVELLVLIATVFESCLPESLDIFYWGIMWNGASRG